MDKPVVKSIATKNFYTNFINRLSDRQKSLVALGASTIIVVFIGGAVFFNKNQNLVNTILGKNPDKSQESKPEADTPALRSAAQNLNNMLSKVSNDSIIYQTINFEDLPIYPQAWVERYFDSNEINNALIGGVGGDPDSDGLSNKQEYLYGSDPKNKDTLCAGKIDGSQCVGRNDKQNVDVGISPLTGLELETPKKIKIKKQDLAVVNNLQSSFETASQEGVDFPSLYQLSKTIDLGNELEAQKVLTVDDTAQSILDYQQFRIEILGDFADDDEFSSFTKIYELSTPEEFDQYISKYNSIKEKLTTATVPKRYEQAHKAYILLFQKLVALVEHRKSGVAAGSVGNDFKVRSKQLSTEMVWAYRRLNDELVKASELNRG